MTQSVTDLGFDKTRLGRINDFMKSYVDKELSAGIVTLVARHGEIIHFDKYGHQDLATQTPMSLDSIFRIYSMTKPITSVAIMILCERGQIQLLDPLEYYIPSFKKLTVFAPNLEHTVPTRPPTIRDLLTHSGGISYGDFEQDPPHELYKGAGLVMGNNDSLEVWVDKIAELPLLTNPGTEWHYSLSTDILGRVVELVSGKTLGQFFQDEIFEPLGMVDTFFEIPEAKVSRLATLYGNMMGTPMQDMGIMLGGVPRKVARQSGGGGLLSTAKDYLRFADCIRRQGVYEGGRLLGRKSIELMTTNHLPDSMLPTFLGEPKPGIGFGLGFRVVMDGAATGMYQPTGSHGWGGWANTVFWVDPDEDIVGILLNQYLTNDYYPIREHFYAAVYQALI